MIAMHTTAARGWFRVPVAGLTRWACDQAGDWQAYEQFKRRLSRHVGWNAARPELRTCEAYEIASKTLADALEG